MAGVAEFMSRDHDRLDAIFTEFQRESDAGKAKDLFSRFDVGLRAHIAWEEELLFPPFEERTGLRDFGPTAAMRMEHRQIEQLLQVIGKAVGRNDLNEPLSAVPGTAQAGIRALIEVLAAHNNKEENILYPLLDQSLSEEETSVLLGRIKGLQVNV